MTLTAHAITGAAVASVVPSNPVLGFLAGFASHFVLDAIPHWDYSLSSSKEDQENPMNSDIALNKSFFFDLLKMGADALLGAAAGLLLFGLRDSHMAWGAVAGIFGGLLPDALQFFYMKWRHEPLLSLQKFHALTVHSKIKLKDRPLLGISSQLVVIAMVTLFFKLVI